jgi:hypothetical protein
LNIEKNIDRITGRLYRDGTGVLVIKARTRENIPNPVQKRERKYHINKTHVRSASLACWGAKQSKFLLFITFTFPYDAPENEASAIWKLTLDSLRNTYHVKCYVWVKERQQSGRLHYHILVDRNRINIQNLQQTYNNHILNINNRVIVSSNSVRLGHHPIVRTPEKVANYLSKYIAKSKDNEFNRRAFGTTIEKTALYKKIDVSQLLSGIILSDHNGWSMQLFVDNIEILHEEDYFLIFRIRDYFDVSSP